MDQLSQLEDKMNNTPDVDRKMRLKDLNDYDHSESPAIDQMFGNYQPRQGQSMGGFY